MRPIKQLHDLGQSIWLDNITRDLVTTGTLRRYIDELSVTGLTSNPTIFDQAFLHTDAYDAEIMDALARGESAEDAFFGVAIADLRCAADHFRAIWDETGGVDGWVSLEVSPLVAYDPASTLEQAKRLHATADRPNLFIKIPGTPDGLPAIEDAVFAGVPVNVTLLFSREQYLAAAEAYLRGLERRAAVGLKPNVASVASVFVSRWDTAVGSLGLGVAMAKRTYGVYRDLLASARWRSLAELGARPQRLLWASTGVKDPSAPDTLYVTELAAPGTINTMPEATLLAFADHGGLAGMLEPDDWAGTEVDVDLIELSERLQKEGAESFNRSWDELLDTIVGKSKAVAA